MGKIVFTVIITLLGHAILAQTESDKSEVYATLNNYIEGTSYSRVDLIKKAFSEDAKLFLDNKQGESMVVSAEEYASWFSDPSKAGKFNGRFGNILSVEIYSNVAMARAEILIPSASLRFVDMFILKKANSNWKIISKTAGKKKSNKSGDKVLFVVSNANFYGSSDIPTGNSYSEIIEAYDVFDKGGYNIDFVSIDGGAVPFVYVNMSNALTKSYMYNKNFMHALANTKSADQVSATDYRAIYFVGGGSVMFRTPEDRNLQTLAMQIYEEQNGVIASICHGTAGIVNLRTKDGKYLVDGKTVTGYPEAYENQEKEYFKQFPFLIQETIENRNGTFNYGPADNSYVEIDGRLVTGQNHLSAKLVAESIINILAEISD